ncbi:hypothetical protein JCM33374_g4903 [Metschnikowia sp. JCM 33374]|nr:hypothetical protein JCM33374_g4903 [Metschnikowia sp. JCM 33374]
MLDFLRSSSSTESKIRTAINDEPLGPYNKELLDLAILTHDRRALAIITSNLQKKLSKLIKKAESPKRSYSVKSLSTRHHRTPPSVQRSSTVDTYFLGDSAEYRKHLGVLKCLTVIVHLCQNGSHAFLLWVKQEYSNLICPIGRLSFHPKTSMAIYSKVELIVRYCESTIELTTARQSLDQIRSELRTGIKHED